MLFIVFRGFGRLSWKVGFRTTAYKASRSVHFAYFEVSTFSPILNKTKCSWQQYKQSKTGKGSGARDRTGSGRGAQTSTTCAVNYSRMATGYWSGCKGTFSTCWYVYTWSGGDKSVNDSALRLILDESSRKPEKSLFMISEGWSVLKKGYLNIRYWSPLRI